MTYFSSYYPDVETTRLDIQSRIRTLQDRLYMRRELTDDIQRQQIQVNINNLYRLLKETIDSQSQIHSELAYIRSQVDRDSRFQNRIVTLQNTRKEAAERAILLQQQLREISADRRYPLVPPPGTLSNIELAERELLDDRLRREYSDITASSEIRRQQLMRESERLDRLAAGGGGGTDYLRKDLDVTGATGFSRKRGESDSYYDKKDLPKSTGDFPLRNQQFQNLKQQQQSSRKYDTPFKAIDPKLGPYTGQKLRSYPGQQSELQGQGQSQPRRNRSRSRSNSGDQDQSERLIQKYARGDKAREYQQIMGKYRNPAEPNAAQTSSSKPLRQSQLFQKDKLMKKSRKEESPESSPASFDKAGSKRGSNRKSGHYTFNMSMLDRSRDRDEVWKRSRSRSASTSRKKGLKRSASKRRMKHNPEHAAKIKANAIERINHRLQQAWAIYQDSEFRNVKHEHDHLFNTYANQQRFRKQIRDKIEFQPQVQRKFGFHVEA